MMMMMMMMMIVFTMLIMSSLIIYYIYDDVNLSSVSIEAAIIDTIEWRKEFGFHKMDVR